jgi:adenosylcobinamide-phosphate synthase
MGWFSVLAALGLRPAGAVLYRTSEFVASTGATKSQAPGAAGEGQPATQAVAAKLEGVIDFVPARVTSLQVLPWWAALRRD